MYVRWLDEIENFRFDVSHLPTRTQPEGLAVAARVRRRRRPRAVDGRPGESAGALLASRSRRIGAGVARGHPRWVCEHFTHRCGHLCQRLGGIPTPFRTPPVGVKVLISRV